MVHLALKRSTKDFHLALETKLRVLLSDQLSIGQYAAIQKKFYGFYKPVEARLSSVRGWDDPEFELQRRLKLALLSRDLAALDVDSEELAELPCCESLPRLETVPQALGCLYVLEGSTLGGKIIVRRLQQVLPLHGIRVCSFFSSYGDDVGRMWLSFLSVLERHCEAHCDADVVVHSACEIFRSLNRWLSDVGVSGNGIG